MADRMPSPQLAQAYAYFERIAPMNYEAKVRHDRELASVLSQVSHDEVHQVYPAATWRHYMQDFKTQLFQDKHPMLRLEGYSLLGSAMLCEGTGPLDSLAAVTALDPTRPAVSLSVAETGEAVQLSIAAYLVARYISHLTSWWDTHLKASGKSLPLADWNASADVAAGLRLAPMMSAKKQDGWFYGSLLHVLRWAQEVDLELLASVAPEKPHRNRLVDAVALCHQRAYQEPQDILHLLLGRGANLMPQPRQPGLLHVYAAQGNEQACLKLLEHGYPTDHKDSASRTPARVAQEKGHEPLANLLRSWEARAAAQAAVQSPAPGL